MRRQWLLDLPLSLRRKRCERYLLSSLQNETTLNTCFFRALALRLFSSRSTVRSPFWRCYLRYLFFFFFQTTRCLFLFIICSLYPPHAHLPVVVVCRLLCSLFAARCRSSLQWWLFFTFSARALLCTMHNARVSCDVLMSVTFCKTLFP